MEIMRQCLITVGIGLAAALLAGCGGDSSTRGPSAPASIPQPTQAQMEAAGLAKLPVAPESERIDIAAPTFSDPTSVTNPLFPIGDLDSAILSGRVDGKPFHTETTLLPDTRIIEWAPGQQVETLVSQYMAFIDGRLQEAALDYYAQADDGSVWYLGEDVNDYKDGLIFSTEGTWLAGKDGYPAMIMPGDAVQVGDVHRAENIPGIAFEEVEVTDIDKTMDGPTGPVHGGLVGAELHDDGTYSDKWFAPGYGEFFSAHQGELEAMALALPTDALDGPAPAELEALSASADAAIDAALAKDWQAGAAELRAANAAWKTYRAGQVPPLLATEMERALKDLAGAIAARDEAAAGTAAIDVAQSTLDLRLRYEPPADIDRARFELWARQMLVDAAARDEGSLTGDIAVLEWVRDRFAHALDSALVTRIDTHVLELHATVEDGDLPGAAAEAQSLLDTLAG